MTDRDRPPWRQVRAAFDHRIITVYQAFSPAIATPAVAGQRFVAPFGRNRMSWIKPSFAWMMYRSGWATKPGQERVLAIDISRDGFDWALTHASLSSFEPRVHPSREEWNRQKSRSPVRVQWDPERSLSLRALDHRAIQIGLSGDALHRYVDEWTVSIRDITEVVGEVHAAVRAGDLDGAGKRLPAEDPYPVPEGARGQLGMDEPEV